MLREKCSFRRAQQIWADFLGVTGVTFYDGKSPAVPDPDDEPEPDDTVGFIEPTEPDAEIKAVLAEAAGFYHELLLSGPDKFANVFTYLERRGVERRNLERFQVGYSPGYAEAEYAGRSLINAFLPRFQKDYRTFHPFYKGCLVRLLNDESAKGYGYYRQQIDFSRKDPFSQVYGDYFAGRIVFPIRNADAEVVGFIGRRLDNRGVRWLKQQAGDTAITTKSWLYGIDKAHRFIKQYRTVILVEGIFDYFAFYNLLQDQEKPVVVSTLGSYLPPEAMSIFRSLEVEHFIVAYDWDPAGRKAITRIAEEIGSRLYYLGGMRDGQDPFDKLRDVTGVINGFSLRHLVASAKKHQPETDKPIHVSFISCGTPDRRSIEFSPVEAEAAAKMFGETVAKEYYYDVDDFLPLLSYDHGNKAMLDQTLSEITRRLEARHAEPQSDRVFTIPVKFLQTEAYTDLGPALIFWLRLAIEQQTRKRKVRETDAVLAGWLSTTRRTILSYKQVLMKLGYLNIDSSVRPQQISVSYFPRQ